MVAHCSVVFLDWERIVTRILVSNNKVSIYHS